MDESNKKTRRLPKEERKQDILEKSLEVFIDKGYARATTAELAKNAGISEVTLFRYFSSKQEIFLEAINPSVFDKFTETIEDSSNLSQQEKLETTLYRIIKMIIANSEKGRLLLMETTTFIEWNEETLIDKISATIRQLTHKMGVVPENEELVLRQLLGSYLSFLFKPEEDDEKIRHYVANLVRNILPLIDSERRSLT